VFGLSNRVNILLVKKRYTKSNNSDPYLFRLLCNIRSDIPVNFNFRSSFLYCYENYLASMHVKINKFIIKLTLANLHMHDEQASNNNIGSRPITIVT
jgi:hypothetical protein